MTIRVDILFQVLAGLFASLALCICAQSNAEAGDSSPSSEPLSLTSPNGKIAVRVVLPAAGELPQWSATLHGKPVLADCRLGLQAADGGDLLRGARVSSVRRSQTTRRIPVLFGKADHASDNYRAVRIAFGTAAGLPVTVEFRCFDDAVAFRYEVGKQAGKGNITILDERTSFAPTGSPTGYVQYLENYRTSHEHAVTPGPAEDIKRDTLVDMPATFAWPDGTYVAITEAALRRYAGMSLMRTAKQGVCDLECRLTPREDSAPAGAKVVRPLPMETPWRVALIGDRPGALLESNTLYCLNAPSAIKDTSWIKPGKITFSWWNGNVYDGKRGIPILSVEMAKRYIDFCARSGIAFHSVVSDETVTPWYHRSNQGTVPGPDTDVTRVRDDLDLPAIRKYAKSKGVRLWTWVHQAALRGKVEPAFTAFEKMGWSGMMVNFFDHDDQATVEFAEEILQSAAKHHIAIHFHGIWKPTGMQRTYPNLMNHEGALNLEYMKWSDRCPPEHTLLLTFTRLIAGPMDYHAGGFRAVTRAEFAPHNIAPNVLGTRCFGLAMYVCFDNPNPMVADYPTAYEGQSGFEFLEMVPTYWDETRVLIGEVGELLVTARRKGKTWYVGGMSAVKAHDVVIPLDVLGSGGFTAEIWKDAEDSDVKPNTLNRKSMTVIAGDKIKLRTAIDGGFVLKLTPAR